MKLIKNIKLYSPEYLGVRDVFIAGGKICKIGENIKLPSDLGVEIIDGTGLLLLPGFIDSHVHILGGGGEGGFANRTPESCLVGSYQTRCHYGSRLSGNRRSRPQHGVP